MRKGIIILLSITGFLFSQNFNPPVTAEITSDYGPRNYNGYDWHPAIDYGCVVGTEVHAVEEGNIVYIRSYLDGDRGGWRIRIHGNSAYWTYMHLFRNDPNPQIGDWEARMATLENPNNPQHIINSYVFIFWIDRNQHIAEKVLAPFNLAPNVPRWYVRWDNDYIRDQNGDPIQTQDTVVQGEVIAPSGESGSAAGHPHLDIRSGSENGANYDINPFYYINHDQPNYTVSILYPSANSIIYHRPGASQSQQLNERFRVNVNSAQGLDLDRVFIYFFKPNETQIFDDAHRYAKILYGGPPPNNEWASPDPASIIDYRGSLTQTGVDPQGNGNDDFYFVGFNSKIHKTESRDAYINFEAKFEDGYKVMIARAENIRYNNQVYGFNSSPRQIILDNFVPYVDGIVIYKNGKEPNAWWPDPINNEELGDLKVDERVYF